MDTATSWDVQVVGTPTDPPPGPTGVNASLAGGVFTISWDAVAWATNYLVEHRTGGEQGTWASVATGTPTSLVSGSKNHGDMRARPEPYPAKCANPRSFNSSSSVGPVTIASEDRPAFSAAHRALRMQDSQ